jgi:hypothetical protein
MEFSPPLWAFLLFSRTMSLLTVGAEVLFVVVLRQWAHGGRQPAFRLAATLFMGLLAGLYFLGEPAFGRVFDWGRPPNLLVYRVVVWDFTAALYTLLEGACFIYVLALYRRLKREAPEPAGPRWADPAAAAVVFLVFSLWLLFEAGALTVIYQHHLSGAELLNPARIFRLVMGAGWTLAEALLAVYLIRIYQHLKNRASV